VNVFEGSAFSDNDLKNANRTKGTRKKWTVDHFLRSREQHRRPSQTKRYIGTAELFRMGGGCSGTGRLFQNTSNNRLESFEVFSHNMSPSACRFSPLRPLTKTQ
jgi:hypothetical protein